MSHATTDPTPNDDFEELLHPGASNDTVTNDAVAGETVTGADQLEGQPQLPDNELSEEQVELDQG